MSAYPISSMTGYARRSTQTPWGEMQLELRAVNHRYLDLSIKIPEELRALEQPLRGKLKAGLGRGKVDAYVRLRAGEQQAATMDINHPVLQQLMAAVETVRDAAPDTVNLNAIDLLRWPGVLNEQDIDAEGLERSFNALADDAIRDLQEARAAEGARLAEVLSSRLGSVEDLIEQVLERLPEQSRLWREKLQQRMEEMTDMEPERREQSLVQFIQRLDVDEEIERLKSHVAAVREVLASDQPVGRKLDFFMQEFNREANTLGSKSMDAELTRLAVELKVVIEQMREQVQNVE